MNLKFGALVDLLRPIAKFWWRDPASATQPQPRWSQLSYQEYTDRGLGRDMQSGLLQVMGLKGKLVWPCWTEPPGSAHLEEFLEINSERLIIGPRVLTGNSASNIAQGLDDAMGELSWKELQKLLERNRGLKVFCISFNADLLSANVGVKLYWAERVQKHNEKITRSLQSFRL